MKHLAITVAFALVYFVLPTLSQAQVDIDKDGNLSTVKKSKLIRLNPVYPVWIDHSNKVLIADGEICLREGALEMFACLRGSKEHESIISIPSKAINIHAGLLAIGAEAGSPVKFDPEFQPPTGTEIEIFIIWEDDKGKKRTVRANDWIQHAKTKKNLETNWVFAGSYTWKDEDSGETFYTAEGGDLVCVSNFSSAMLDLPVQSSQQNSDLFFLAHTKRIPPLGTKVRMILVPKPAAKKSEKAPEVKVNKLKESSKEDISEAEAKNEEKD